MDRFVSVGLASKILGVSVSTLRRWEKAQWPHSADYRYETLAEFGSSSA